MDTRLHRNVEPQLRPEHIGDQMVAVAERYDATMYRTGSYNGSNRSEASSRKPHTPRKRIPPASSLPHQHSGIQAKERPQPRRGPIPNPTSPVRLQWIAARQKQPVSTAAKADQWQMNAQRKKLGPTMFASERKAQTAVKTNMSPIQTAQRS